MEEKNVQTEGQEQEQQQEPEKEPEMKFEKVEGGEKCHFCKKTRTKGLRKTVEVKNGEETELREVWVCSRCIKDGKA